MRISLALALGLVLGLDFGASSLIAADEPGWVLVGNHLHSSAGGDKYWQLGIKRIRSFCDDHKIQFAILTDHDTIEGWFDPVFKAPGPTTMIPGQEWTSAEGHANLVGFSASGPQDAIKPEVQGDVDGVMLEQPTGGVINHQKMIDGVHARGGLVFINHPALRGYRWPEATYGADMCEVNGTWENPSGMNAKAWWVRRLAEGSKIGAVGGSDYHAFRPKKQGDHQHADQPKGILTPGVDEPINLVLAEGPGVQGVYKGLRKRHVQVVKTAEGPRCYARVDANGDGKADDGVAGDELRLPANRALMFHVRVVGAKGKDLFVHDVKVGTPAGGAQGHTIQKIAVTSDDFTAQVPRVSGGAGKNVTFFEVGSLDALTNPFWY